MEKKNLIYCFDLDNTLCITEKNLDGSWNYIEAQPIPERIKFVNELYSQGHHIIVETARGCGSGYNWYDKTFKQLSGWGLNFHQLRTGVKFGADIFVDDRAINSEDFFNGNA